VIKELENVPLLRNGKWAIIPFHYSCDREKDYVWVSEQRGGYMRPEDWNREMEIDFTQVAGIRAYPVFKRERHVDDAIVYNQSLPLCLCVDFNVGFMAWPIIQVVSGALLGVDEITLSPTSIPEMVDAFRNRYARHPGELWIYGDATGHARSAHDKQSSYDLMRMAFQNYPSRIVWKVPVSNPPVSERIDSVNNLLSGPSGETQARFHSRCVNVIRDGLEVLLDSKGAEVQEKDPSKPASQRTHAMAGFGYMVARERPTLSEAHKLLASKTRRKPLVYGTLLGER
jgi:hypothetical protein